MGKLHFIRVDVDLDIKGREEFAAEINKGLAFHGRPNDRVFLLHNASWLGSVDMGDEAVNVDS